MITWPPATLEDIRREQLKSANKIVASQERIATGIDLLGFETARMTEGIRALSSALDWYMTNIAWQLEKQSAQLEEILNVLKTPRATQARELRNRRIERFNNGWYDEALQDFQEALALESTDFIAHKFMGNIYLVCNNPSKSLEHFEKAVKFAAPYSPNYASYALLHVAHVHKLQGDLAAAYQATAEAVRLLPEPREPLYQHARCCALLDKQEEAIHYLEAAIRKNRDYALRADGDKELASIKPAILNLYERLRQEAKAEATQALHSAERALDVICHVNKLWEPQRPYEYLSEAKRVYSRDSLFDYQDAASMAYQLRSNAFTAARNAIDSQISILKQKSNLIKLDMAGGSTRVSQVLLWLAVALGTIKGCSAAREAASSWGLFVFLVFFFWLLVVVIGVWIAAAVLVSIINWLERISRNNQIDRLGKLKERLAQEEGLVGRA